MKSPISWVGNKSSILKILYALFPAEYERYIEPFGGSGAVLLGKERPDRFEVFNDFNGNLVNLYRCMRDRPLAFIRALGFLTLNAREDFHELRKFLQKEETESVFADEERGLTQILLPDISEEERRLLLTERTGDYDLKRAAAYLKLLRYSYCSGGKSFAGVPFSIRSLFGIVEDFAKRMDRVVIENQDFAVLIRHYDRENAFVYCDPPYYTSEYVYDIAFQKEDHIRLSETLKSMQGKFLLSYNDCPQIRALYKDCNIFAFSRMHSMVQRYEAGKEFGEILIANYDFFERERERPQQVSLFDENLDEEKRLRERILR